MNIKNFPKRSIEEIFDSKKIIWIQNINRTALTVTLKDGSGDPYACQIPKTWIPIPISETYPREHLKMSQEFRAIISKRKIKILNDSDAQKIMNRKGYEEEFTRINEKNKNSSSVSEFGEMLSDINIKRKKDNVKIDIATSIREKSEDFNKENLSSSFLAATMQFNEDLAKAETEDKKEEILMHFLNILRNTKLKENDLKHLRAKYHQYKEILEFIKEEYDIDKEEYGVEEKEIEHQTSSDTKNEESEVV